MDAFRRPRTERVIVTGREMARLYELRGSAVEDIPSALLNQLNWNWDINLEEHWDKIRETFKLDVK
jgi:hypothetical protein